MDVFRSGVAQVYLVYPGAVVHVQGHAGRGGNVVQLQFRGRPESRVVKGGAGETPAGRFCQALPVNLFYRLLHFKEPGTAGNAVSFQRGRDGQADGFFRAGPVGHYQIGSEGIQMPLRAFHRGIEGFQVNGQIDPFFHTDTSFPRRS